MQAPPPETVFQVRGLTKVYEMGEVTVEALRGVDWDLAERELDHFPSQLSGGEQQRVAIARAISRG